MSKQQEATIAEFQSVTGCDPSVARLYLEQEGFNLGNAINTFLNHHDEPKQKNEKKPEKTTNDPPANQNINQSNQNNNQKEKEKEKDGEGNSNNIQLLKNDVPMNERYRACMLLSGKYTK